MSVICESFPSLKDKTKYEYISKKYVMTGNGGLRAEIITYGARIYKLFVPDSKTGELTDVMLGMNGLDEYLEDGANHGAVVGRSANRIAGARFQIDGVEYKLPQNDGTNNLHTGNPAYQNKFWSGKILNKEDSVAYVKSSGIKGLCDNDLKAPSGESVLLVCESSDGECGFPGNLTTEVLYSFLNDGTLLILYKGVSDKKTVFAPTHHAYFNIEGHDHGSVADQILTVLSDKVTLKDSNNCPDGSYMDVEGTPFDFKKGAPVSQALDLTHPQIKDCKGIDQNFCLKNDGRYELVSKLETADGSKGMEVWTDLPGIQYYAGNHLGGTGYKDGADYKPYDALCLEAQMYPNAVNIPEFKSPVIDAGIAKYCACGYRFY